MWLLNRYSNTRGPLVGLLLPSSTTSLKLTRVAFLKSYMHPVYLSFDTLIEIFQWISQPSTQDHLPGTLATSRRNMVLWPPRPHRSKDSAEATKYLLHCALVCKEWRDPALYVLYHDIIIKIHKRGGNDLVSKLRKDPVIGSYVKTARLLSDDLHAKALLYLGLYCPRIREVQINHIRPFHNKDYEALKSTSPFRFLTTLLCVTFSDPAITLRTLALMMTLMPSLQTLGFSNFPPCVDIFDLSMPSFLLRTFYSPNIPIDYTGFCRWLLTSSTKTLNTIAVDPIATTIAGLEPILHEAAPNLTSLQLPMSLIPSINIQLMGAQIRRQSAIMDLRELSLIHSGFFPSHLLHHVQCSVQKITILPHPFQYRHDFNALQICSDLGSKVSKGLKVIRIQSYQGIPSCNQLRYMENWCTSRQIKLEIFEDGNDWSWGS